MRKRKRKVGNQKPKTSVLRPKDKRSFYSSEEGYRCSHCGNMFSNSTKARELGRNFATTEHICPKSLKTNFVHSKDNLCLLCKDCNEFKRDKLVIPSAFYKYLDKEHIDKLDKKLIPLYEAETDSAKKLSQEEIDWYDMYKKVERQFKGGNLYKSKKLVMWVRVQSLLKRKRKLENWKKGYMKRLHPEWSYLYADRLLNVYCKLQKYYNNKDYYSEGFNLHKLIEKLELENKHIRYRILLHLYETYGLYKIEMLMNEDNPTSKKALKYLRRQYKISRQDLVDIIKKNGL